MCLNSRTLPSKVNDFVALAEPTLLFPDEIGVLEHVQPVLRQRTQNGARNPIKDVVDHDLVEDG